MSYKKELKYPNNWTFNEVLADLRKQGYKDMCSFECNPDGTSTVTVSGDSVSSYCKKKYSSEGLYWDSEGEY